jgi:type I restriction enzyme S subunit
MLVPKLRFREFTDEWKIKKLAEITDDISYGMNSASTEYDGINKYIRITDIDDSSSLFNQSNIVSPLGKLDKKFLLKQNDILFARTGASTGKSYLYNINDGKLYFAGFLIKASINNIYNSRFIFEQLKLSGYKNWVKLMSMRSGQPGINANEYGSYKVFITSKSEQDKIANFISLLNKKIELQTKKIETLKLYKIGIKNILLSNSHFEKHSLSEILEKWNIRNKNNEYDYVESISNKYGFIPQEEQFSDRSVASKDKSNYYIIMNDVFAYNPSRLNVGSLALKRDNKVSLISPLYECFKTNQNQYFLFEWFNSNEFKKGADSKFEGGVRNTLNFSNLCKINISLPSIDTQNKYADFFEIFNKKISSEEVKLNELINLKKGLMQNMFV